MVISIEQKIKSIEPIFDKNSINICFSVNNDYVLYLTVCIHSILKNSNKNDKYDIVILENNLNDENKRILKNFETNNVAIRFYSMADILDSIDIDFFVCYHFSKETYFRLFIPDIFKNYAKVMYLDCDAVCASDISELYNQDLDNNMIGAVKDILAVKSSISKAYNEKYQKFLNIENPSNYVNTGVMLLDIQKMIDFDFLTKSLDLIKHFIPKYVDQCIINKIAEGHIKYLSPKYNITQRHVLELMRNKNFDVDSVFYQELQVSVENPVFFHFIGSIKPWQNLNVYNSALFWRYAKETEVYRKILFDNMFVIIKNTLQTIINYRKDKWQYLRYRVLSKFVFGKTKIRYQQKKQEYKKRVEKAERLAKKRETMFNTNY